MTTRKEILIKKYIDFTNDIQNIIDENIFPSLEDIDIADLVILFSFTFQDKDDYHETITNLLSSNHIEITKEKFNELYPIIIKYINELKDFLKSN